MTDWARIQTRDTGEGVTGYSVRPDLWWPPGQEVRGPNDVALVEWHRTTSAWILRNWADQAEDQGLGDPGVAEALVLAGQVRRSRSPDWASPDLTSPDLWTSCPRPEGSQ